MLLGALVDAGAPLEGLRAGLAALPLAGYELTARRVSKHGIGATQVEVVIHDRATERRLSEILAIVESSGLNTALRQKAQAIFQRIGEVEAGIHGAAVESVHLHELGGLDTIVDVVGVLLGLELLGVEKLVVSPLPLGRGYVQTAHGWLPLPAPATLELLEGLPVTGSEIEKELVTPTGAALLAGLAQGFGPIPPMRLLKTGYGAGRRDLPVPNLLRLLVGEAVEPAASPAYPVETLACLECNLDNLNPEIYGYVFERLFAVGALDVWLAPIQMKKNRPGTLLSVLCREGQAAALLDILFRETTTLGARKFPVQRYYLEREFIEVQTEYGPVRVKVARGGGQALQVAPEYEDCRRLAEQTGAPLQAVYRAALRAAGEVG
jgi:hypothetical protein